MTNLDPDAGTAAGRAVVVGAGIGGLAAAVGLRRVGWNVTVLERAPAPGEVGAGLSLWSNALRALDALGVGASLRARGTLHGTGGLRTPDGAWLVRASTAELAHRHGVAVLVVHRRQLHDALRAVLPDGVVRYGCEVTDVEQDERAVTVHFRTAAETDTVTADLVVGADGLGSGMRETLWPGVAAPRYAGCTAWRGVTAAVVEPAVAPAETWGRGSEFGVVPMADGRVYWFGTANLDAGTRFADEYAEVQRRFSGWHEPIPRVLAATPAEAVLHHDIVDLADPLRSFVSGRCVLLGDAAHAMTPNLGQGACLALEDAVVLADALRGVGRSILAGLAAYDRQRRPRTQAIGRLSRRMTGVIQRDAAVWVRTRNAALRLTPSRVAMTTLRRITDWSAPTL